MPSEERKDERSCGDPEGQSRREFRPPTESGKQMCATAVPPGGAPPFPEVQEGVEGIPSSGASFWPSPWLPQATASKHSTPHTPSSQPVGGPSLFFHPVTSFAQEAGSGVT